MGRNTAERRQILPRTATGVTGGMGGGKWGGKGQPTGLHGVHLEMAMKAFEGLKNTCALLHARDNFSAGCERDHGHTVPCMALRPGDAAFTCGVSGG